MVLLVVREKSCYLIHITCRVNKSEWFCSNVTLSVSLIIAHASVEIVSH